MDAGLFQRPGDLFVDRIEAMIRETDGGEMWDELACAVWFFEGLAVAIRHPEWAAAAVVLYEDQTGTGPELTAAARESTDKIVETVPIAISDDLPD